MTAIEGWRQRWDEFWSAPVAAERLALVRITTGVALLTDILVQQLPFYEDLFSVHGLEPLGYSDAALLHGWRWTGYFFTPSDLSLIAGFVVWMVLVLASTLGVGGRFVAVLLWLFTLAMLQRHYYLKNFGDSVLRATTFLLMFVPSCQALSWSVWRKERKLVPRAQPAWGVRLFQLQLCAMYGATAVSKLLGPLTSTWYQGTSLHYALNDILLGRWAYPLLPLPLWATLPLSNLVLFWEVLFVPLVLWRRTRRFALAFGIAFHVLSALMLELGWFGFYVLCWYCAWIPDEWFTRVFYPKLQSRFARFAAQPSRIARASGDAT